MELTLPRLPHCPRILVISCHSSVRSGRHNLTVPSLADVASVVPSLFHSIWWTAAPHSSFATVVTPNWSRLSFTWIMYTSCPAEKARSSLVLPEELDQDTSVTPFAPLPRGSAATLFHLPRAVSKDQIDASFVVPSRSISG